MASLMPSAREQLSPEERQQILEICEETYQSLPLSQIVPTLADRDTYIVSESSFYRVLKEADQLPHRESTSAKESRQTRGLQSRRPKSDLLLGHPFFSDHYHRNVLPTLLDNGRL